MFVMNNIKCLWITQPELLNVHMQFKVCFVYFNLTVSVTFQIFVNFLLFLNIRSLNLCILLECSTFKTNNYDITVIFASYLWLIIFLTFIYILNLTMQWPCTVCWFSCTADNKQQVWQLLCSHSCTAIFFSKYT